MRPTVSSTAEELYASLGPWAASDGEGTSWALLLLCESLCSHWQDIEDLIRDTDAGPGWSSVMDADTAPAAWLPWLGQFIGQAPDAGITTDQQRAELKNAAGWKRGTPASIETAIKRVLTGTQWSTLVERSSSPYHAQIFTRRSETPDIPAVLSAAASQKPAGLVFDVVLTDGVDEAYSWTESVTATSYVCSFPSSTLYPSDTLIPC